MKQSRQRQITIYKLDLLEILAVMTSVLSGSRSALWNILLNTYGSSAIVTVTWTESTNTTNDYQNSQEPKLGYPIQEILQLFEQFTMALWWPLTSPRFRQIVDPSFSRPFINIFIFSFPVSVKFNLLICTCIVAHLVSNPGACWYGAASHFDWTNILYPPFSRFCSVLQMTSKLYLRWYGIRSENHLSFVDNQSYILVERLFRFWLILYNEPWPQVVSNEEDLD